MSLDLSTARRTIQGRICSIPLLHMRAAGSRTSASGLPCGMDQVVLGRGGARRSVMTRHLQLDVVRVTGRDQRIRDQLTALSDAEREAPPVEAGQLPALRGMQWSRRLRLIRRPPKDRKSTRLNSS